MAKELATEIVKMTLQSRQSRAFITFKKKDPYAYIINNALKVSSPNVAGQDVIDIQLVTYDPRASLSSPQRFVGEDKMSQAVAFIGMFIASDPPTNDFPVHASLRTLNDDGNESPEWFKYPIKHTADIEAEITKILDLLLSS